MMLNHTFFQLPLFLLTQPHQNSWPHLHCKCHASCILALKCRCLVCPGKGPVCPPRYHVQSDTILLHCSCPWFLDFWAHFAITSPPPWQLLYSIEESAPVDFRPHACRLLSITDLSDRTPSEVIDDMLKSQRLDEPNFLLPFLFKRLLPAPVWHSLYFPLRWSTCICPGVQQPHGGCSWSCCHFDCPGILTTLPINLPAPTLTSTCCPPIPTLMIMPVVAATGFWPRQWQFKPSSTPSSNCPSCNELCYFHHWFSTYALNCRPLCPVLAPVGCVLW